MSAEAAIAMKWLVPGLGVTGGAGLLLAAAATNTDLDHIKEYGSMVLLFILLVWMTQVLAKKLDKLDDVNSTLHEVKASLDSQTRETTEVRHALERQDRRLEAVEQAIKEWGGE